MTQPKNPYEAALTILRLGCARRRDLTDEELDQQDKLYVMAVGRHDVEDVRDACVEWASTSKWWPELAELLVLVREKEGLRRRARDREGAAGRSLLPDQAKLQANLRNEAIRLLGDTDNRARRHFGGGDAVTGAKTAAYLQFLNEAAQIWAIERPSDEAGHGWFMTGYDVAAKNRRLPDIAMKLQAWASTRLNLSTFGEAEPGGSPVNAA